MSGLTNSFKLAIAQNENLVSTSPRDENRKLILRTNRAQNGGKMHTLSGNLAQSSNVLIHCKVSLKFPYGRLVGLLRWNPPGH